MRDCNPDQLELVALQDCPLAASPEIAPSEARTPFDTAMPEVVTSSTRIEWHPTVRTLKIEQAGDFWKGHIKPKIRLMGHWLGQAGFCPGLRVQVTCVAPGVIELRAAEPSIARETDPPLSQRPDVPS